MTGSPRMLVAFTFAAAVVVGLVISLATGSWWVLVAAVLVHFGASTFVLGFLWKRFDQQDKPDPVTEARLEAEQRGAASSGTGDGASDRELVI